MIELSKKEKQSIFNKYRKKTNMSYSELFKWSKTNASNLASLDRTPIMRNLRLLRKPISRWTIRDYTDANRTISFISRMKKVKKGKKIYRNYSKRDISLKNWAFDINK